MVPNASLWPKVYISLSLLCGAQKRQHYHMKPNIRSLVVLASLTCLVVFPKAQAVSPSPDGCYPAFTTAEGCNSLRTLTSGVGNTGVGWESLHAITTGSYNTAVGAGALVLNTGDSNTAVGTVALFLNTTGTQNTAIGTDALVYNDSGNYNTAVGYVALQSNTIGVQNCGLAGAQQCEFQHSRRRSSALP
jgi:hypothetical protein